MLVRHSMNTKRTAEGAEQIAAASGLRYVSDSTPGISRRHKRGKFEYYSANNRRIRRSRELRRIAALNSSCLPRGLDLH